MKKATFSLAIICLFGICVLGVGNGVNIASAATVSQAECDQVFIATVNELLPAQENYDTFLEAAKTMLYDIELEPLGYLYSFTADSNEGFAIIINANGKYECEEIYFDSQAPYDVTNETEYCIYVNLTVYWSYVDGHYYDAQTDEEVPDTIIQSAKEKAYYSSNGAMEIVSETLLYTFRSETAYPMVNKHPYISATVAERNCVPIMGANIVQFFDRYSVNLIADFTPGMAIGSLYRYKAPSAQTSAVVTSLANDMGTIGGGTTQAQFASGMSKYCSDRNYSFSYTSCMSNGQFNYDVAKTQMQDGKPLALFLDPFTIETITVSDGYDSIEHSYFTEPHSMSAFGYWDITYTLQNGQSRCDSYLQVATGKDIIASGYFKIGSSITIDQAMAVRIY